MVGWIGFGLVVVTASPQDGQAPIHGAIFAMVVGAVGLMAWLLGIGFSITELIKAGGARSRFLGWMGVLIALIAPVTWAAGWAIAAFWFLESMPGHIL